MGGSMLWAKILALAGAGVGWYLMIAAVFCELDPGGVVSAVLGAAGRPEAVASHLRGGCEACLAAALVLVTAAVLAEDPTHAPAEEPRPRRGRGDNAAAVPISDQS